MSAVAEAILDRTAFDVVTLDEEGDERQYWLPEVTLSAWKLWNCSAKSCTAIIQLPPHCKEFLKLLNSHEVQYLMIGGYAVNYYGYSRAAADLDVWIAIDSGNANRLEAVLREFGFPQATSGLFLQPGSVIRMGGPPIRLEILTTISGVEFESCFPRRIIAELDGIEVNFIAVQDLRQIKAAAGRLKDRMDLGSLPF